MPNKTFDPYDFSKKVIDNVPVYYKNFPNSPCVHIHVCFNVGVLNDKPESVGISHFLEHLIFDGSPKLPTKKIIEEWKKVNTLGSWNAWTYFTNTNYHLKCLPEKLDVVLDGMADMIFNPLLKSEDVEHERKVIIQEAWGRFKNEKLLSYIKEDLENSFHGTLRANASSPLGWPDTVEKIKMEDIKEWHKAHYGKGNFFIVISGNIKEKDLKKIEKFIKLAPKAKKSKLDFGKIQKPKKLSVVKNSDEIGDPREQVEITFGRVMPTKDCPNEQIELMSASLLYDILFERLRTERALCYGVGAGSHTQRDFTVWGANLKTKEEAVETVKTEFWKALDDIFSGKEKARFNTLKQVRIDRLKSMEEITGESTDEALSHIWQTGKIITKSSMLKDREKVTYADVVKCLKKVFDKDWTTTEIILPSKK